MRFADEYQARPPEFRDHPAEIDDMAVAQPHDPFGIAHACGKGED
jgi:hypothetical protein